MTADPAQGDPDTYAIIGAAMEVHRELNRGFAEAVYKDALAVEFTSRKIQFDRETLLQIRYKGGILPSFYKADFVCFGNVVVEAKAIPAIGAAEESQLLNYLRITGHTIGLLLNFGAPSLQFKRLIFTPPTAPDSPPAGDISL